MRRSFAEVDDSGVVVDVHHEDVKGNRGKDAKEPKKAIRKRKSSHKVVPSAIANKGDRWLDKHGCFLRPLQRTDEMRDRLNAKLEAKRERELKRAEEKGVTIKSRNEKQ